jgi:hypothetical protein
MASRPVNLARVQSTAQVQRDEAIHRAGLTRRVAIGGAAALTAGIAAFVSAIAPGRTLGASRTSKATVAAAPASTARTATSTPKMPPLATASQLGLAAGSAPQSAPSQQSQVAPPPVQQAPVQQAPIQQPPPVVSGGS